jgi:hypothetical protein
VEEQHYRAYALIAVMRVHAIDDDVFISVSVLRDHMRHSTRHQNSIKINRDAIP